MASSSTRAVRCRRLDEDSLKRLDNDVSDAINHVSACVRSFKLLFRLDEEDVDVSGDDEEAEAAVSDSMNARVCSMMMACSCCRARASASIISSVTSHRCAELLVRPNMGISNDDVEDDMMDGCCSCDACASER